MESSHGHLGARFANGLSSDYAHRFADCSNSWPAERSDGGQHRFSLSDCPTESTVPAIIDHLERLCAVATLDEAEGLQLFLNERLEQRAGASVTTSELLDDYRAFCQSHNAPCYAGRKFLGLVTAAIRDRLGVGKNHCVRRPKPEGGVSLLYGFRNLGLKGAIGAIGA